MLKHLYLEVCRARLSSDSVVQPALRDSEDIKFILKYEFFGENIMFSILDGTNIQVSDS